MFDSARYLERSARQVMLPEIGEEGQRRLRAAKVAIIGVGGLGSAAAAYLAGAGVGTLVLADPDTVSLSNLQRQALYSESEIGCAKTACARRRLHGLNSDIRIEEFPEGLTGENGRRIVGGCTLVADCTDNYVTRYLIDDLCAEAGIPWIYGSIGEFTGQLSVMNHTRGVRYTDLYPEREELCALPRPVNGVVGAVPGVIGALQAAEAIKLITGCGKLLDGRLFSIDILTMESFIINI